MCEYTSVKYACAGGRVISEAQSVGEWARGAEIKDAVAFIRIRHGHDIVGVRDHTPDLFRVKEERFVFFLVVMPRDVDRAAQRPAEIVVTERWPRQELSRVGHMFIKVPVRVQRIVAEKLVGCAVELVRARTGNHVDLSAGAAAIF